MGNIKSHLDLLAFRSKGNGFRLQPVAQRSETQKATHVFGQFRITNAIDLVSGLNNLIGSGRLGPLHPRTGE